MKDLIESVCQAHKDTEGQLAPMWNCNGCKLRQATGELVKASRPYVVIPLADLPKCSQCGGIATAEEIIEGHWNGQYCDKCQVPQGVYYDYPWAKYLREQP